MDILLIIRACYAYHVQRSAQPSQDCPVLYDILPNFCIQVHYMSTRNVSIRVHSNIRASYTLIIFHYLKNLQCICIHFVLNV